MTPSQPPPGPREHGCISEAALLLARNDGAAERLLTTHRPMPDGRCGGCGTSPSRWPCVLVVIAEEARDLIPALRASARQPRDLHAGRARSEPYSTGPRGSREQPIAGR